MRFNFGVENPFYNFFKLFFKLIPNFSKSIQKKTKATKNINLLFIIQEHTVKSVQLFH